MNRGIIGFRSVYLFATRPLCSIAIPISSINSVSPLNTIRNVHTNVIQRAAPAQISEQFIPEAITRCQIEFTSGAGGTESMLFTAELLEMYRKLCIKRGWEWSMFEKDDGPNGGIRAAIVSVGGKDSYPILRFEAGIHRVQRIPVTDKSRVHTSTASISVLPEPEESQIVFKPNEIKIETMRASGPGGQNVNKRSSAVRMTHLPTKVSVKCMDERFQHANMKIAYKRLGAILLQRLVDEQQSKTSGSRRLQVGTKARSEKIRTYNFKDDRITDHRLRLSTTRMTEFLNAGEGLDLFIAELQKLDRMEREQK